jgi:hypothetical protein
LTELPDLPRFGRRLRVGSRTGRRPAVVVGGTVVWVALVAALCPLWITTTVAPVDTSALVPTPLARLAWVVITVGWGAALPALGATRSILPASGAGAGTLLALWQIITHGINVFGVVLLIGPLWAALAGLLWSGAGVARLVQHGTGLRGAAGHPTDGSTAGLPVGPGRLLRLLVGPRTGWRAAVLVGGAAVWAASLIVLPVLWLVLVPAQPPAPIPTPLVRLLWLAAAATFGWGAALLALDEARNILLALVAGVGCMFASWLSTEWMIEAGHLGEYVIGALLGLYVAAPGLVVLGGLLYSGAGAAWLVRWCRRKWRGSWG